MPFSLYFFPYSATNTIWSTSLIISNKSPICTLYLLSLEILLAFDVELSYQLRLGVSHNLIPDF